MDRYFRLDLAMANLEPKGAHQPLHDEVSLPGTDDGEPTASVERI